MSPSTRLIACAVVALGFVSGPAVAASGSADLTSCVAITDNAQRLACYDGLAKGQQSAPAMPSAVAISKPSSAAAAASGAGLASKMSQRWELEPATKNGVFSFRAHKPNYILIARNTDNANEEPYQQLLAASPDSEAEIQDTEAKYQLSFKVKSWENLLDSDMDLWVAYTQQSFWQVYNDGISAPFRETNYEPEIFVTKPLDFDLLGLETRFVNFGAVHQSNGRSDLLSRSWNRIYAQVGFEYEDQFNLTFKPWYRIPEDDEDDDNPHINDYVGDYELVGSYRLGRHTLTALGRTNYEFDHSFLQLDWSYPIVENLKGYIQFTTGYGESLIDYDHTQNTIGVGVLLTDWM